MAILLVADHDNATLSDQTNKALTAASQIGVVQASDRHKVILNNPWGSRRYLELPEGELLPRIC